MAAPVHPTAVQTAQATPPASEPVDSMAVKARAGFLTGQLPPQLDSQGSPPLLPTAATPFGLRLTDVSRDEALLRMGLLSIGALVTEVVPGGDGAQAGLQPGDRLVRVASQPVVSTSHFVFVAAQQRGGPVEIEVIRAGTLYRAVLGGGAVR
jgi:predicted metalloprotease with PDZ domain